MAKIKVKASQAQESSLFVPTHHTSESKNQSAQLRCDTDAFPAVPLLLMWPTVPTPSLLANAQRRSLHTWLGWWYEV